MKSDAKIIGAFEVVSFPLLGMHDLVAKIDTGADTGALHVTHLEEVKPTKGQQGVLSFRLLNKKVMTHEYFHKNLVRSSSGHVEDRYFIKTEIAISGVTYPITIGLTDRSSMKRAVLIGKRFLSEQKFLVDVRLHDTYRYAGRQQV
ncbi:MAG: peptidase [Candidatus Saccharibacteria bacterium]|nr:peptidase [Candidatus Saccharibacteria bacterium]